MSVQRTHRQQTARAQRIHRVQAVSVATQRVGLIGDPVAHSFSPRLQQPAFDALGIPARYELWQTGEDALATRVASLLHEQCLGANVTIPYKAAVLPMLDFVDPMATSIGAVNTIVHRDGYLHGYNTDAPGLLNALAEQGIGTRDDEGQVSLKGSTVVLLGAGGAARGAAFAVASACATRLIIVNRTLERAQTLATAIGEQCAASNSPGEKTQIFCLSDTEFLIPHPQSILINATSVGMHRAGQEGQAAGGEDESPLSADTLARFAPDTFVFDMIYNPVQTRLLVQARALGLRAINGLPMLLHQGALAFTLWTGQPAPLDIMRSSIL